MYILVLLENVSCFFSHKILFSNIIKWRKNELYENPHGIKMAAEEEAVDLEETENDQGSKAKKSAKHDSGAADLEKVTDYVEEAEISSNNLDDVSIFGVKYN